VSPHLGGRDQGAYGHQAHQREEQAPLTIAIGMPSRRAQPVHPWGRLRVGARRISDDAQNAPHQAYDGPIDGAAYQAGERECREYICYGQGQVAWESGIRQRRAP
jgi:hypothetical protein